MGLNIKPKFDATVQTSHQSQQYGIYAQVSNYMLLFYISRRLKYSIYSGAHWHSLIAFTHSSSTQNLD